MAHDRVNTTNEASQARDPKYSDAGVSDLVTLRLSALRKQYCRAGERRRSKVTPQIANCAGH